MLGRREFLAGAALGAAAGAQSPVGGPREGAPVHGFDIVDMHGHFGPAPEDAIWPHTLEAVLEDYRRCGIGTAVVSHFDAIGATSPGEYRRALEESAAAVRAHPRRLRAHLVFHPVFTPQSLAAMRDTLRPGSPFCGFKLHTELHRREPDDAAYTPLYRFADEQAMPVLVHVGANVAAWVPAVERVARAYPRLTLIVAHFGGGEEQALAALSAGLPNLCIDTCLSSGAYRQMERLVAKAGPERVLFATDGGYLSPGAQLARIALAELSDASRRAILGGNARRIYGKRLPGSQEGDRG